MFKKPLLRPLTGLVWRYICASSDKQGETIVLNTVIEKLVRRPILYQDRDGLEYLLYPDQNAQAYFNNEGNYEVRETKFLKRFVKQGMIIFDVGAHIGLYSLLFAKLVGPEGQVHAFEPEIRNHRRLMANVMLNGYDEIIHVHQKAVFSRTETLQLNIFSDTVNAWHSLGNPILPDPYQPSHKLAPSKQQEVQGISLDDYCASSNITHIDFLKVDVEGAEIDILRGAERLFRSMAITAILFEVSTPQVYAMNHQPKEIFSLLNSFGFRSYPLSEDGRLLPEARESSVEYQNFVALADERIVRRLEYVT